jgi:hypothetical protein
MDDLGFTIGIVSPKKSSGVRQPTISIVPDEELACPGCGAFWGHPDKALDFPNRFKVDDFCRCYNPACDLGYYNPYTGETEAAYEMTPEEAQAIQDRVSQQIAEHGMKVLEYQADGTVIDRSIPPKGNA